MPTQEQIENCAVRMHKRWQEMRLGPAMQTPLAVVWTWERLAEAGREEFRELARVALADPVETPKPKNFAPLLEIAYHPANTRDVDCGVVSFRVQGMDPINMHVERWARVRWRLESLIGQNLPGRFDPFES